MDGWTVHSPSLAFQRAEWMSWECPLQNCQLCEGPSYCSQSLSWKHAHWVLGQEFELPGAFQENSWGTDTEQNCGGKGICQDLQFWLYNWGSWRVLFNQSSDASGSAWWVFFLLHFHFAHLLLNMTKWTQDYSHLHVNINVKGFMSDINNTGIIRVSFEFSLPHFIAPELFEWVMLLNLCMHNSSIAKSLMMAFGLAGPRLKDIFHWKTNCFHLIFRT